MHLYVLQDVEGQQPKQLIKYIIRLEDKSVRSRRPVSSRASASPLLTRFPGQTGSPLLPTQVSHRRLLSHRRR